MASDRDSAQAARAILSAFEAANLPALEDALERWAELLPPVSPYPDLEAERWELLQAVSQSLLEGIRRLRKGLATRLEGLETSLVLLAHLARRPPLAMPGRIR
ncbi:MAG: hypothetical protein RMI94_03590 [Bryobacterales bacterium]|nr:hypothetical protein [Bryobacteraceae bacterium]MDW8129606.1 hypothetical protein [Bryobacterales bacterium]